MGEFLYRKKAKTPSNKLKDLHFNIPSDAQNTGGAITHPTNKLNPILKSNIKFKGKSTNAFLLLSGKRGAFPSSIPSRPN